MGTAVVGVGVIVSGAATYGFLALTARAVGPERYASISVLWGMTVLATLGFLLPVEQEVARAIAHRRARGVGAHPVVVRAAQLGAVIVAALLGLVAVTSSSLRERLFDGSAGMVGCLAAALGAYLLMHLGRGVTSGSARFAGYAFLLGGEAVIRLVACVVLFAAGVETTTPYGLALAFSPLLAVAVVATRGAGITDDGPPAPLREVTTALGQLVAAAVLAQLLVNGPLIAVRLLAEDAERAAAGRFLAGLVVARIPLFLFAAVQAALLPRLAGAGHRGPDRGVPRDAAPAAGARRRHRGVRNRSGRRPRAVCRAHPVRPRLHPGALGPRAPRRR